MISAALAVLETAEERNELSLFYEKNKNRFYAIAFERLHNAQDAEDTIQETFLRIANKPDKFFSISDDERIYFVCAIVRNVAVDIFNKKAKRPIGDISDDEIYQSGCEPLENHLLEKISHDELLDFINNLPELQRNALILTCLSGLSISETAETLNVSKAVVNQRLCRARKAVKAFVKRKNNE